MKWVFIAVSAFLVSGLAAPISAAVKTTVICDGTICGGSGNRQYVYNVTVSEGTIHRFHVGTCDPNENDYKNWVTPDGWSAGIFPLEPKDRASFTNHGGTSSPNGTCDWMVVWTEDESGGPGLKTAAFGFDNSRAPHDVGWEVDGSVREDWSAKVGTGTGPVHGPTPEPSSILGLAAGLGAFIVLRKR